jgi:hypothetical protein
MAKQTINVGTTANDRTGDPIRIAFQKTNANFTEVYDAIDNISIPSQSNTEFISLSNRYTLGTPVTFLKVPGVDEYDEIDTGLTLARDPTSVPGNGGIYNIAAESVWDVRVSPEGLLWNWDGWENLDDVKQRQYVNFRQALKNRIGQNVIVAELVAHDTINDKYYTFMFTAWTQGAEHEGIFGYTRRLINVSSNIGVIFPDGSNLVTVPKKFYGYPQTYVGDTSAYTLVLEDAGKHVYAFGVTITVPNRNQVDFPIGTVVKIVAENQPVRISAGSGVSISSSTTNVDTDGTWIVPASSIATLIKTRQGTGVNSDIWRLDSPLNKAWVDSESKIFSVVEWNSGRDVTITATPFETSNAVTYDARTDSEYIYFVWDQDFIDNVWEGWQTEAGEGASYSISLDDGATWIPVETSGYNGGTFFYFWIPNEFRETYSFTYDIGQAAIIRYNRGSNIIVWFDLEDAPVPANTVIGVDMSLVIESSLDGDPVLTARILRPNVRFANALYDDNTGAGSLNEGANVWSGSSIARGVVNMDIRRTSEPQDAGRVYATFDDGKTGTMKFYWNAKLYTVTV